MQENQKREIFFISRSAGIFFFSSWFVGGLYLSYILLAHIKSLVLPPTFD